MKIVISPAEHIPQGKLDSSDEVKKIVQRSGAKGCVSVSHNPSVQVYFALRRKIEQSDDDWLDEFLRLDGLESLLDSLCHMTGKAFTNFSDAILMLDCVCCIRSVLNRQIGLEFVLQQEGESSLTRKLITGTGVSKAYKKIELKFYHRTVRMVTAVRQSWKCPTLFYRHVNFIPVIHLANT